MTGYEPLKTPSTTVNGNVLFRNGQIIILSQKITLVLFFQGCLIPGGGAFEIAASCQLVKLRDSVKGRARLGVQAFADALLIIPKVLAQNAGFDPQDTIVKLQEEYVKTQQPVGLDLSSGSF